MTPLERMSRARWARVVQTARGEVKPFDALPETVRRNMMEDDRVALLALTEAELPEPVAHAGHHAISGEDAPAYWQGKAVECFRAMCRAIAEDRG